MTRYLRSRLSKKERAELKHNLHHAAAWMKPIIEQIALRDND